MSRGNGDILGSKGRALGVMALALMALVLAACAPTVQRAGQPGLGFQGPRLEADDVISFDGARLGLSSWTPKDSEPWAVIVGVHGMNDYAAAFHLAAPWWAEHGIATFAYDQRGFGRSPRRGVWASEEVMAEDLRTVTALVRQRYPKAQIAIAGESMGAAVAIEAFASPRPPAASRLILVSPAVWGWSSQGASNRAALWVTAHVAGPMVINPPRFITDHISASDNIDELVRMGNDPLELWGARADALYELVDLMQHAWADIGRVQAPVLDLHGAHDEIIPAKPALQAAARLKPTDRSADYARGWHLLLVDKQAETVWRDIAAFIANPDAPLPSGAPPIAGAPTRSNSPAPATASTAGPGG
jgi:alpha-beta hydrolase superfamily lysophospholipase